MFGNTTPATLQHCHYHLQEIHDAEDLTQETFARFFASLDRYKHYGKAANYLYVIAGNLCRDHYRRQSELPLADLPEPADRPLDTLDTRPGPGGRLSRPAAGDSARCGALFPPGTQAAGNRQNSGHRSPLVKYRIHKARELLAQFLRKEAP